MNVKELRECYKAVFKRVMKFMKNCKWMVGKMQGICYFSVQNYSAVDEFRITKTTYNRYLKHKNDH